MLATDATSDEGLSLAPLAEGTERRLAETLPDAASTDNPVDVLGDADVDRFERAIDAVLGDPTVDAGVVLTTPHPLIDYRDLARAVVDARETHGKPVVTCLMDDAVDDEALAPLREAGVPNYFDPGRAARSLRALVDYGETRGRNVEFPPDLDRDADAAREVVDATLEAGRSSLGAEVLDLLSAYGISTPASELVATPAEAAAAADRIGGPVAMKVVSPDVAHKTDVGGVEPTVPADDAAAAFERITGRVTDARPDATVEGVLVQERVPVEDGVEVMIGATRDTAFGPTVTVGLGGTFVEVLQDVSFGTAPLSRAEAAEMVEGLDGAALLRGARGADPVDEDALVDAICRVSRLVVERPSIRELDVNPLLATPDGVVAVDLQATLTG